MREIHKIAIFFDGTWNTIDYPEKFSNVKKMKDTVVERYKDEGLTTVTDLLYMEGPGTRPGTGVWGGAFAADLDKIIIDAYIWLAQKYHELMLQSYIPEIYIFGFSRGSYLAHIFSWVLNDIGVTRQFSLITQLIGCYMRKSKKFDALVKGISPAERNTPPIRMLGLWDMVSAPLDIFSNYHDGERAPIVQHIYHAMSLDEKRLFFPVLKYKKKEDCVCQRWFSGVHSDIGGGYEDATLSDISLDWMIDMAVQEDLIIKDITASAEKPGKKEDFLHMEIHDEAGEQDNRRQYEGEEIDESVYRRMAQDKSYTPFAVDFPREMT